MSKILKLNLLLFCLLQFFLCGAQNLHKKSKDLPQVNKQFNFQVYVSVDTFRNTNTSPAQLQSAIETANRLFEPIGASFAICGWETIPDYTFDEQIEPWEDPELRRLHNQKKTINVYILDLLRNNEDLCGYAGGNIVFLRKGCLGSLTHELGHVFGLAHPFAGGDELVDGSNCATAGDRICDTPADPHIVGADIEWQDGCEFIYEGRDANGDFYQPDVGNIMSYYACACGFTHDQYVVMANNILNRISNNW